MAPWILIVLGERSRNALCSIFRLPTLAGILFAALTCGAGAQPYRTGLKPPDQADLDWGAKNIKQLNSRADLPGARQLATALPAQCKNIEYLPKVGLQAYGSCVSWAMIYYYKTWQEAREHGWHRPDPAVHPEQVMSPAFVFNLANAGIPMAGTGTTTNMEYLMAYGTCTCAELDPNANPSLWPTEAQYLAAFPQRSKSYSTFSVASGAGMEMLKAHLASGDLAIFSMTLYLNFTTYPEERSGVRDGVYFGADAGVYIAPGAQGTGHEMCIIGYDDNKVYRDDAGTTRTGAMLIVNSWGTDWGVEDADFGSRGFLWVGYDYFRDHAQEVQIMEDRIGYQPSLIGSYHLSHSRALEVNIDLLGGDRDSPDWTMSVFPRTGGNRYIDATVVFDATDNALADNYSWWLRISDVDLDEFRPNGTGQVTSFKMKRLDGILWDSPDCPVDTVEINIVNQYAWANVASLQHKRDWFAGVNPAIGSHAWGDLDGDGDVDLIFLDIIGENPWAFKMRAYRNEGAGVFTQIASGLPAIQGDMALGDYNGDGLLDVVANGYDEDAQKYVTSLWRNIGDCLFVDSGIHLPISDGRLAWIDFDQDGRLDLSFDVFDEGTYQYRGIRIYRNTGAGFVDLGIELPNSKQFAWGDFDRDGKPDLALAIDEQVIVERNTGGAFEPQCSFAGDRIGAVAWGDVDNDGWLDLALSRADGYGKPNVGEVWRNDGSGYFELYGAFAAGIGGGLAWGDVDNDGRADLATWGDFGGGSVDSKIATRVYRNLGAGSFQNLGFNLWGAGFSTGGPYSFIQWLDIDGDGDLDLSVCGPGPTPYPQPRQLRVYENLAAQAGGLNRPNQAPSVPAGLAVAQSAAGQPMDLSWAPSTDHETPAAGLYYDVRIGRQPGWDDLMPADASAPVWGANLRPTLSNNRLGLWLRNPPAQPFYWSVRAIDPSQTCSAWSAAQLAAPFGMTKPGDANRDGKIDVADLTTMARMKNGQMTPDLQVADFDWNGKVDAADMAFCAAAIIGAAPPLSPFSQRTVASGTIGPAGGSVAGGGIALTIPSGAFAATHTIAIERNDGDAPFGTRGNSPVYRVAGLPDAFAKPLTLRLHATATRTGKTFAMLGEVVAPPSAEMTRRAFRLLEATSIGGGDFTIQIGAAAGTAALHPAANSQGYELTFYTGLVSDYNVWANAHFSIAFPTSLDFLHVTELGKDLEDAYQMLKSAPAGTFSYAGRTAWPVCVTILDRQNTGIYGEFVASMLGDNHGAIEINSQNIADYAERRVTAIHEFFHLVQNLYDPRYAYMKAKFGGDQLWMNEAASVWSEELLASSGYVSPLVNNNLLAPFEGLQAGAAAGGKVAQDHGYGMASLIRYFIRTNNEINKPNVVRRMFEKIKSGLSPVETVRQAGPTATTFTWWPDYLIALVRGDLYPFGITDIAAAAGARQFNILADADLLKTKSFGESIPDLSGRLHMAIPTYVGLTDKHRLSLRLTKDEKDDLRLAVLKAKTGVATELLGEGVEANGAWKYEIPNLAQFRAEGGWRLLSLVSNQKHDEPETGRYPYTLKMAVTCEGTQALPTQTVYARLRGTNFPQFACSGSLTGRGWADWHLLDVGFFKIVIANVPALPPIDYNFTYTASLSVDSATLPPDESGEYEVWSTPGIKGYHFAFFEDTVFSPETDMRSTDGKFAFQLDRDDEFCGGTVYAVYDVAIKRYDAGGALLSESTEPDVESAIMSINLMP